MIKHLVIGLGEVGSSWLQVLTESLPEGHSAKGIDKGQTESGTFHYLHICIPYSDKFIYTVNKYRALYGTSETITIIHSTVKIGTTDQIPRAVHSPTFGVHPNLVEGIKTFPKYAPYNAYGQPVLNLYDDMGLVASALPDNRTAEALKIWCTTQYAWNVILEKEMHKFCEAEGVEYEWVYQVHNRAYNYNYTALGMPHVVRPYLKHMDGPIGGHCLMPNIDLLLQTDPTNEIANFIKDMNEGY